MKPYVERINNLTSILRAVEFGRDYPIGKAAKKVLCGMGSLRMIKKRDRTERRK